MTAAGPPVLPVGPCGPRCRGLFLTRIGLIAIDELETGCLMLTTPPTQPCASRNRRPRAPVAGAALRHVRP